VDRRAEQALQHPALRDHTRAVVDSGLERSCPRIRGETALRRALRARGLRARVTLATPFYLNLPSNIPPMRRRADGQRGSHNAGPRAAARQSEKV